MVKRFASAIASLWQRPLIIATFLAVGFTQAGLAGGEPGNDPVQKLIDKIRTEKAQNGPISDARYELAMQLAEAVRASTSGPVSDQEIRDIVNLLNDPDDRVRQFVAIALGNIGPRARPAVPALETALCVIDKRIEELPGGMDDSSDPEIRVALSKIDGRPVTYLSRVNMPKCPGVPK